jgi:hypothetical protein
MASHKQTEANRRNSQRSTGPRTPEGKAAVCQNALATGIYAKHHVVTPTEDPKALDRLVAEYYKRFAPTTPEMRCLVDCLVADEWRLRRFLRTEGEMLSQYSHSPITGRRNLGEAIHMCSAKLELIERRISATRKSYLATLKALNEIRAAESPTAFEPSPRPEPLPAPKPVASSNQPLAQPIGFVPSIPIADPIAPPNSALPTPRFAISSPSRDRCKIG